MPRGKSVHESVHHVGQITGLSRSYDGNYIASASRDHTIRITVDISRSIIRMSARTSLYKRWGTTTTEMDLTGANAPSGTLVVVFYLVNPVITSSPDAAYIAAGSAETNNVFIWRASDGQFVDVLEKG